MANYIVATVKSWDVNNFYKLKLPGSWTMVTSRDELLNSLFLNPRYIFFTHWSWLLPKEICDNWECVVFHPADLPEGRGSSVIQYRIQEGIYHTKVSALRANERIDRGDIYFKRDLCLNGNGEEIYLRLSETIFGMIKKIVETEPIPTPQAGKGSFYNHRTPDMSRIQCKTLKELHDFVRMLDADSYPKAFIDIDSFRLEFTRSSLRVGHIVADVKIKEIDGSISDSIAPR